MAGLGVAVDGVAEVDTAVDVANGGNSSEGEGGGSMGLETVALPLDGEATDG